MSDKITVFIPAYNKQDYLEATVKNVFKAAKKVGGLTLDILIVNDASVDNTGLVIKRLENKYPAVRSVSRKINKGLGSGLREAVRLAKYPVFLNIPGDNDADINLLISLMKNRNKADVVLSYFLNKEERGRFRNFLSTLYGMIYMLSFGIFVEYLNCVGLYSTAKIRKIGLKSDRFGISAELNVKLLRSGCTFYEVAGFMRTGVNGSTSVRFKNLGDVMMTYFRILKEIYITKRNFYNKKPLRIYE